MEEKRTYQIRQEILNGLNVIYPAGRDVAGLARFSLVAQLDCSRDELLREARNLEKTGYIANITGVGRNPYWKITSAGVKQITKDMALDEFVWGEEAL